MTEGVLMRSLRALACLIPLVATVFAVPAPAATDALPTTKLLPLALANAAALAAVAACEASGYHVTATVVDAAGLVKAVARGDQAGPHTLDSSRAKAYTIVTLGPLSKLDASSELVARLLPNAESAELAHLPGVLLLSGAVVLKAGSEVIGAIGVGGAPGGKLDEACARAGADKIKPSLG